MIVKPSEIKELSVAGYKSIYEEQKIRVAPLTILAGANSSGKSSFMQPFLLMKQTLESPYDPGVFLFDGENVKLTHAKQIFSTLGAKKKSSEFTVKIAIIGFLDDFEFTSCYELNKDMKIKFQEYKDNKYKTLTRLYEQIVNDEIVNNLMDIKRIITVYLLEENKPNEAIDTHLYLIRQYRSFFLLGKDPQKQATYIDISPIINNLKNIIFRMITNIIHLPGLRGNPERAYPKVAVSDIFPGRFEVYTASIIHHWQINKETEKIQELESSLQYLGLTSKIEAKQIYDTRIELHVGRLPTAKKGRSKDMVNIADVGFGVSQTLPILVALIQAKPEHTVYIEQPETHLHPKAQYQLAELFAKAAKRGVRLIIETHSSLIIQGIQTLVAKGEFAPKDVALHWFSRDKSGATKIDSSEMDENGAFGDWPEDFDDTFLQADSAYLDAVESKF